MIAEEYQIRAIPSAQCRDWFLRKHYARRLAPVSFAFGLYRGPRLLGVCSFGHPMSPTLVSGAFGGLYAAEFLELNRLVVTDGLQRNALSFFVSQSLGLLPRPRVVVSYADPAHGHHGYIYQATNWTYTGLSAKRPDYKLKGQERLHTASITDKLGRTDKLHGLRQIARLRELYGSDFYMEERPRKHRYFYIIGSRSEKKERLNSLAYPVQPYPKGDNHNSASDYEPASQGLLFT